MDLVATIAAGSARLYRSARQRLDRALTFGTGLIPSGSNVVGTTGVDMPPGFPSAVVERVNAQVARQVGTESPAWTEFAGGWNGLTYRLVACRDAADEFSRSLADHGESPQPRERYRQDSDLFAFFVCGLSALECFTYAVHAIGWMAGEPAFAMATESQRRGVSIPATATRLTRVFAGTEIGARMTALVADPTFVEWGKARNHLAHRASPARLFFVGGEPRPAAWWELQIDSALTRTRLDWLVTTLNDLLVATDAFAGARTLRAP